jgi:hypothetical protein
MRKILLVAAFVLLEAASAVAQERLFDGVMGGVAGALVGGPVGLVAGGLVGATAGPAISSSWGLNGKRRRVHRRRHYSH